MELRELAEGMFVGPQIAAEDIAALKRAGVRSLICNRPDGEAADQPGHAVIAAAARAAGMELRYIPVVAGAMTPDDVQAFQAALRELPAPVLAYCRSGARSSALWSAAGRRAE